MKNQRERMVYEIRSRYGLTSPDVLSVMLQVPRHNFVSKENQLSAYKDAPVPIGFGQTMSQPYTVAFMTDLLISAKNKGQRTNGNGSKNWRVLEIGTGSGYQGAVLSKLVKEVYTIEIIPELAEKAKKILKKLGYKNVFVRSGSGESGWKDAAPFDAIMITAGIRDIVPKDLFEQLIPGGFLVAPVGKNNDKTMIRYTKQKNKKTKKQKNETKQLSNQVTKNLKVEKFGTFHFVPFIEEKN